nr:hypothetical protein [Phaeacidiphilus oryzae]
MPEQDRPTAEAEPQAAPDNAELDIEAPEADTAEQRHDVAEDENGDSALPDPGAGSPIEADPYDAAEQRRVVQIDEDDYR